MFWWLNFYLSIPPNCSHLQTGVPSLVGMLCVFSFWERKGIAASVNGIVSHPACLICFCLLPPSVSSLCLDFYSLPFLAFHTLPFKYFPTCQGHQRKLLTLMVALKTIKQWIINVSSENILLRAFMCFSLTLSVTFNIFKTQITFPLSLKVYFLCVYMCLA